MPGGNPARQDSQSGSWDRHRRYGSWALKNAPKERGLEPDECYIVGSAPKARPDLAIEVIWTSGGLDKLEVYRELDVPEVWVWRSNQIEVYELRGEQIFLISRPRYAPDTLPPS